ncbi:uncharacterized protein LOC119111708 [Pollicipes pollicipes]|uniref:uncharacterized protein LOC119111708 n=1 Tax=Pollicipes pollicipes TaxID=41117 RepID=UPI0018852C55|nr:uncharacterized protein LOC119111708 [Pollicipes pollicipes]
MKLLAPLLLASVYMTAGVVGHGRLMDPPCRASMWRLGYDTPADYNDNQLFCGGKYHQQTEEGGKCGICGDPYDEPQPRTHEIGGRYYKGYLVRNYTVGSEIDVTVQITANHLGYFQFKMCPITGNTEATQECLNKHVLKLAGSDSTDYYIPAETGSYTARMQLPSDLECEHCVLQWRYHGGNDWGMCPDGTGKVGCGPQEEFYGCADVSVRQPAAARPVLAKAGVWGHGRLVDPPCRATMWRQGYDTPADYNDNQLFCGGKDHQQADEGGKCGICGDPYDEPEPRTHEIGGPYYKGYLVRNYTVGSEIEVTVQITANHLGFFQFKMCPVTGFQTEATQECLDNHLLRLAGSDSTEYHITDEVRPFTVKLQLPAGLECEHCVFQWRYHGGNDWGECPDGTGKMGCGAQEEFYGCADVSVRKSADSKPIAPKPLTKLQ